MPKGDTSTDIVTALSAWMQMLGQDDTQGPTPWETPRPWERFYQDFAQRYLWMPETARHGWQSTILPPSLLFGTEAPDLVWLSPLPPDEPWQELPPRPKTIQLQTPLVITPPLAPEPQGVDDVPPPLTRGPNAPLHVSGDPLRSRQGLSHSLPLGDQDEPIEELTPLPVLDLNDEAPKSPTVRLKGPDDRELLGPDLEMPIVSEPIEAPLILSKRGLVEQGKAPPEVRPRRPRRPQLNNGDWTQQRQGLRPEKSPRQKTLGGHRRTRARVDLPSPDLLSAPKMSQPLKPTAKKSINDILKGPLPEAPVVFWSLGLKEPSPQKEAPQKGRLAYRQQHLAPPRGGPHPPLKTPRPPGPWTQGQGYSPMPLVPFGQQDPTTLPPPQPMGGRQRGGTLLGDPTGLIGQNQRSLGPDHGPMGGQLGTFNPSHGLKSLSEHQSFPPTAHSRLGQPGMLPDPSPSMGNLIVESFISALAIASSTAFALGVAQTTARLRSDEPSEDRPSGMPLAIPLTITPVSPQRRWTRSVNEPQQPGPLRMPDQRSDVSPSSEPRRFGKLPLPPKDFKLKTVNEDAPQPLPLVLQQEDVEPGPSPRPELKGPRRSSSPQPPQLQRDPSYQPPRRGSRPDDLSRLSMESERRLSDEEPKKEKKEPTRGTLISLPGAVRYRSNKGRSITLAKNLKNKEIPGFGLLPNALPRMLEKLLEEERDPYDRWNKSDTTFAGPISLAKGLSTETMKRLSKHIDMPLTVDDSGNFVPFEGRGRSGNDRLRAPTPIRKPTVMLDELIGDDGPENSPLPLDESIRVSRSGRPLSDVERFQLLLDQGDDVSPSPLSPRQERGTVVQQIWPPVAPHDPQNQGPRRSSTVRIPPDPLSLDPTLSRSSSLPLPTPPLFPQDKGPVQRRSLGVMGPRPPHPGPWRGQSVDRGWQKGKPLDPTRSTQWAVDFSSTLSTQLSRRSLTEAPDDSEKAPSPRLSFGGGRSVSMDDSMPQRGGRREATITPPKISLGKAPKKRPNIVMATPELARSFNKSGGLMGDDEQARRGPRYGNKGDMVLDAPQIVEAAMPLLQNTPLVIDGGGTAPRDDRAPDKQSVQKPDEAAPLTQEARRLKAVHQELKQFWAQKEEKGDELKRGPDGLGRERDKAVAPLADDEVRVIHQGEDLTSVLDEVAEELRWRMEINAMWEAERL